VLIVPSDGGGMTEVALRKYDNVKENSRGDGQAIYLDFRAFTVPSLPLWKPPCNVCDKHEEEEECVRGILS
jgi:hypothetical protein